MIATVPPDSLIRCVDRIYTIAQARSFADLHGICVVAYRNALYRNGRLNCKLTCTALAGTVLCRSNYPCRTGAYCRYFSSCRIDRRNICICAAPTDQLVCSVMRTNGNFEPVGRSGVHYPALVVYFDRFYRYVYRYGAAAASSAAVTGCRYDICCTAVYRSNNAFRAYGNYIVVSALPPQRFVCSVRR